MPSDKRSGPPRGRPTTYTNASVRRCATLACAFRGLVCPVHDVDWPAEYVRLDQLMRSRPFAEVGGPC